MPFFRDYFYMDDENKTGPAVDWVALWILFSAWCSLAGWFLSLLGCLNGWGYGVAFGLFFGGLAAFRKRLGLFGPKRAFFRGRAFRSRWVFPKIWLLLTILAFIGGLIYHPNNYDYLTYRFPRILNWCWEQKWYWIDANASRMNYSATGIEWMMAPLFILFKTDRLFFLINGVSFLLLPGLVFSVFCGLGISKRISWWWMWVLPTGYCYLLQAASVGNDSLGAVYLLAALHFAFKTRETSSTRNFALSCLSIALFTGVKASNLPLVLPCLMALFFNRERLLARANPVVFMAALLISAMVSFFPMALLNIHFTGTYTGDPTNEGKLQVHNPVSGIVGNALQMTMDNLALPVQPRPVSWEWMIPAGMKAQLHHDFSRLFLKSAEMQLEEGAGVGLGIVACVGLMAGYGAWAFGGRTTSQIRRSRYSLWITAASMLALFAFMTKMGSGNTSRLVAAYYPLLIAGVSILASLDGSIIKRSLYNIVGCGAMLSALPLVILSPARPLFPTGMVEPYLARMSPSVAARFSQVYDTYSSRYDALGDLRLYLPESEKVVGFLQSGDDPEVSLWRPFGSRQVIEVTSDMSVDKLSSDHVHLVVVDRDALEAKYDFNLDKLTKKWSATVVAEKDLAVKVGSGRQTWYVLRCP